MPLTLKVVFIGDSKVGKTTVMSRLMGDLFDPAFIMTVSGGWYLVQFFITTTRDHLIIRLIQN